MILNIFMLLSDQCVNIPITRWFIFLCLCVTLQPANTVSVLLSSKFRLYVGMWAIEDDKTFVLGF